MSTEHTAEIDAGCYLCQPDNPEAAEDGCSRCESEFFAYVVRVHTALCDGCPECVLPPGE